MIWKGSDELDRLGVQRVDRGGLRTHKGRTLLGIAQDGSCAPTMVFWLLPRRPAAPLPRRLHASRLVRARSVTMRGDVPSLIASLVITISRTSSRFGRSNMISVIIVSRMARN